MVKIRFWLTNLKVFGKIDGMVDIERINFLARKKKTEGLTPEETMEQAKLRREYIDSIKGQIVSHLDNMYIVDEKTGEKRPVGQKGDSADNKTVH